MRKKSSLERRMLTYFGLIAVASLLITFEFVYAIHEAGLIAQKSSESVISSAGAISEILSALDDLRNKAMLMCVVQAVVTLIVLIMFMRRITGPLQQMVESASLINEGDLSRTINIKAKDEIGLLGDTINSLTSNIQEIVAFTRTSLTAVRPDLQTLRQCTGGIEDAENQIAQIEGRLGLLEDLVSDIKLLAPPKKQEKEDKHAP